MQIVIPQISIAMGCDMPSGISHQVLVHAWQNKRPECCCIVCYVMPILQILSDRQVQSFHSILPKAWQWKALMFLFMQFPPIFQDILDRRLQEIQNSRGLEERYVALAQAGIPSASETAVRDALVQSAPDALIATFLRVNREFLDKNVVSSGTNLRKSICCCTGYFLLTLSKSIWTYSAVNNIQRNQLQVDQMIKYTTL